MYYYNIEIKIDPEIFNGKRKYFWCIIKNKEDSSSNCGHGWSDTIEQAAKDAHAYYLRAFKESLL